MIEEHDAPQRAPASAHGVRLRQAMIGDRLKVLFDKVVNEPIPDEFQDLLRRVDARRSEAP